MIKASPRLSHAQCEREEKERFNFPFSHSSEMLFIKTGKTNYLTTNDQFQNH